jgi:hypothetical protein
MATGMVLAARVDVKTRAKNLHHPDHERQRHGEIQEDQGGTGVEHAHLAEEEVQGHDYYDGGYHVCESTMSGRSYPDCFMYRNVISSARAGMDTENAKRRRQRGHFTGKHSKIPPGAVSMKISPFSSYPFANPRRTVGRIPPLR